MGFFYGRIYTLVRLAKKSGTTPKANQQVNKIVQVFQLTFSPNVTLYYYHLMMSLICSISAKRPCMGPFVPGGSSAVLLSAVESLTRGSSPTRHWGGSTAEELLPFCEGWVSVSLNPQWYFFGLKIFLIRSAFVVCSLQLSVHILFSPNLVCSSSHDVSAIPLSLSR